MATFVWAAAGASTWATGASWKVGGVAQANPPTAADDAVFGTGTGATNSQCTTAAGDVCRSLTIDNAYTGTFILANSSTALTIGDGSGGALSIGTGNTWSPAGVTARVLFVSTSNNGGTGWPITTNGRDLRNVTFSGAGGLWILQDALNLAGSTSTTFRQSNGEVRTNGQTVTLSNAGGLVSLVGGTLTMGTSTFNIACTTASTFWSVTLGTVSGANSTIVLTAASANTRTFAGAGQTYGTLTYTVAGSTGQLTINGSNTFAVINFSDVTNARTLSFISGTTTTITTSLGLNVQGTATKLMSIIASTPGSFATLSLTGRAECSFVSVKDSHITQTNAAFAYNYTNVSGNANWNFVDSAISVAESGAGTDTATAGVTASASDTGTGTDTASVLAVISETDSGSDTETATAGITASATDTGSGTDDQAVIVAASASDTVVTSDDPSVLAAASASDQSTATDDPSVTVQADATDTVVTSDDPTVIAQAQADDQSTATDDVSASVVASADDSGAGADDVSTAVAASADDTGSATEAASLAALIADVDSAFGSDDAALMALLDATDTATASEVVTVVVIPTGPDLCIVVVMAAGSWFAVIGPHRWWFAAQGTTVQAPEGVEVWQAGMGARRWSAMIGECQ